jgi:hypothetical protein
MPSMPLPMKTFPIVTSLLGADKPNTSVSWVKIPYFSCAATSN